MADERRHPNREQREVIDNFSDNILLYAGAGTGKTFTVAQKVKKILENGLAAAGQILCLTFTIKACDEMREDIKAYNPEAKEVTVKTIHSFCYELIKEEARRTSENYIEPLILDDCDQEEILQRLVPALVAKWNYEEEAHKFRVKEFRAAVSMIKHYRALYNLNSGDDERDYHRAYSQLKLKRAQDLRAALGCGNRSIDGDFEAALESYAGRLIKAYDEYLLQNNRLDFDDLIIRARGLLSEEGVRAAWSGRYKFIIVDEMQDTSSLEYEVIESLFGENKVMLCGDFYQTIYEWRGSDPAAVAQSFSEKFKAKTYRLSENYRATKTLSNAAFGFLKNGFPQLPGNFSVGELKINSAEEGEPVRLVGLSSEEREAEFIFGYLKKYPVKNPAEICIMARSNAYIARLTANLNEINSHFNEGERLRFFTVDRDYRFFKKPIVKDILAFWSLIVNPSDGLSLERLAEKYAYGVGPRTAAAIREGGTSGISLSSFLEEDTYTFGDPLHTLMKGIEENDIVVYDIETTGLDLSADQMVQLAAVKINSSGDITGSFAKFVLPTVEIGRGAESTHGFSAEFIKANGVPAETALKEFSRFVEGAVLVGHNSTKFDRVIIDRQLRECNLPPLNIKGEYDTLNLAKLLYPDLKNHKLSTLCQRLDIVNERAHDAFADVVATAKVLIKFNAEKLTPQKEVRKGFVKAYSHRFRDFYGHFKALCGLYKANDLPAINKYIADNFNLKEHCGKDGLAVDELFEIAAEKFEGKGSAETTLRELITDAALAGSQMDILIKKLNKIPVITVHQSKGCEFDTVILAGVDNSHFPSFSAVKSGHGEEEKRVFYVAISRPKRRLILTYAKFSASGYPQVCSPYIDLIPENLIETYEL